MDEFLIDQQKTCYGRVKDISYDIVLLPWGATEPHNLHLPYMTDCILSHDIAVDAAKVAWERYDVKCFVMNPVPAGAQNPGQRDLHFCVHYRYETQRAILGDIVDSLYCQGFRRVVIINGHGGNTFKPMIRDLAVDYPDMFIACSDWYTVLPADEWFDEPGDHAGEQETSVMMHYHPDWTDLSMAGSGKSHPFAIDGLRQHVAWIPRDWSKVTEDTGVGNPAASTAEKGRIYVEAVALKYAELFRDIVEKDIYE